MTESKAKPQVLTSDPKALHKIKFMQFRRQMIPLFTIIILLIANIIYPHKLMFYPTLAAFAWYLLERMTFRTKNKIAVPDAGAFVAPFNGKVQSVRRGDDFTIVRLRKSWLDIVELRLPYPDLKMESNRNWIFETPLGQVNLQIESNKLTFFENKNITGDVIGVIPSSAIITMHVPRGIEVLVNTKQNIFGGETELFSFAENNTDEEQKQNILVEEPIEDMPQEDNS